MPNDRWGHCQHCKYFASPARVPVATEEAACNEPRLAAHKLVVFGSCGCTLFELRAGVQPTAEEPAFA